MCKSEYKLIRKMQWDGDVLKVQDTMHDVLREAKQAAEDAMTGEVLSHFECDFADFREYMHDKIKWEQKQWAAMPKWIPVTERMPERGRLVLAAIYGTDMIVQEDGESLEDAVRRARSGPGRVEMGYLDEDGYWTETAFGAPMMVMPRYWVPLPEPPKNEEEESHENRT